MYSDILNLTQTTEDLGQLREEIRLLRNSLYKTQESFESTLKSQVRQSIGQKIADEISQAQTDKEDYFSGLEKELETLKIITLIIAFRPSQKSIDLFAQWVKKEIGPKVILDLQHNEEMRGGAQIMYEGKFFDGTVKHTFEDMKTELAEYLHQKLNN